MKKSAAADPLLQSVLGQSGPARGRWRICFRPGSRRPRFSPGSSKPADGGAIVGPHGSGKSTLLAALIDQLASEGAVPWSLPCMTASEVCQSTGRMSNHCRPARFSSSTATSSWASGPGAEIEPPLRGRWPEPAGHGPPIGRFAARGDHGCNPRAGPGHRRAAAFVCCGACPDGDHAGGRSRAFCRRAGNLRRCCSICTTGTNRAGTCKNDGEAPVVRRTTPDCCGLGLAACQQRVLGIGLVFLLPGG